MKNFGSKMFCGLTSRDSEQIVEINFIVGLDDDLDFDFIGSSLKQTGTGITEQLTQCSLDFKAVLDNMDDFTDLKSIKETLKLNQENVLEL